MLLLSRRLTLELTTNVSFLTTARLRTSGAARAMPDRHPTENLRALPSVDALLRTPEAQALRATLGAQHLTALARDVTEALREELRTRGELHSTNGE
ncbi:MAG TPA: hypothetical protein VFA21_07410, partial [Pyrinomonadaceae bacterium]|nr:hypothetical protein [Pyrinomonadaceae bacterium]